MAISDVVVDSGFAPTLTTSAVIPVLNGAVTGTGNATAGMATLADLSAFFIANDGPFFMNTATATPSAFVVTSFDGFSSTVSGAAIMGFGTTNDVTLMNRAGTPVLGITANTTGVTMAGALAITGGLSGVTTLAASGVTTLTDATDSTSATTGAVKTAGGLGVAKALFVGTSIKSVSPTAGIGYATGAGGAQTQSTNKQTTVVSNTITTAITLNAENLAAATITAFTFTNSSIAATDTVLVTHESAGTSGAYTINAFPGAGSAVISVRNNTAAGLAEAIVLRVTVVKSVSA
jgi:hypothetical protein